MASKTLPSPDELRQLLRYDPETGKLFWLHKPDIGRGNRIFNALCAGREALTANNGMGYHSGNIAGVKCYAHRAAWALSTGEWPKASIDHIDQDKSNNRIDNLREVGHAENARNAKIPRNNTSGVLGVFWHKRWMKWEAHISVGGRKKFLGYFTSIAEAAAARAEANKAYGYHINHGKARNVAR